MPVTRLQHQKTDAAEPSIAQAFEEGVLLRERTLKTSVLQLDEIMGGFRSSEVTLLDSDNEYASTLLYLLCIRAISEFDEEVVWIDGGNVVNPYAIASLCKRLRIDKRETLSSISLSRAFTAYQLVTLIDEKLEEQIEMVHPCAIIVSSITELFLDKDMRWMESHQLLRRCLEDISRATKEHETISVLTNHAGHRVRPSPGLDSLIFEHADQVVQLRSRRNGILFRLPKAGREMVFSPVRWDQATLDEFRGDSDGKDGAYIPLGP